MYFKRFLQLFVIYLAAALVLVWLYTINLGGNKILAFILALFISYALLTLPLVILTISKANKKAKVVGSQSQIGELTTLLNKLPGYIALSVKNRDGQTSTTIMSFTQAGQAENILYMVADKNASKVKDLQENPNVSFTSWFDSLEEGNRLSSNQSHVDLFIGNENKELVAQEPHILDIHENAVNMVIIKLTINSLLFENFKDGLKVLDFTN